jgi:hypothetical protein
MPEIVDAVDEVVEELFPPKPGGLVDRHRQRKATEKAVSDAETNTAERIEQAAYKAVKVAPESPEVLSAQTFTIGAGQVSALALLPARPYRYRASILVVTAASSVVLSKDQSAALGQIGFTLPSGVVFSLFARAQLCLFIPGA